MYDEVNRHFHVITNLTGAMSKRFICEGCSKSCVSGVTHKCSEACSDCMSIPPCISTNVRIPCGSCNRKFRSQACFEKHKSDNLKGERVCIQKRNCGKCNSLIIPKQKHECFKQYCSFCQQNREAGHHCYMRPLAKELPRSDNVLFVFYDFETTQDPRLTESSTVHIPNLECIQHFCTVCENDPDFDAACVRCGKRQHAFWDDPVGDLMSYLCKPRQWCEKVIAIAPNAKGFDAHFTLDRAILLKWTLKLTLNRQTIVCMTMEHLIFLDSISFLPMALRKLPEDFGLTATKSWYPHFFNTQANRDYVGPTPEIEQYGADQMSESERRVFMAWYYTQKDKVFDNRHVLLQYCQDDVTVLRQA